MRCAHEHARRFGATTPQCGRPNRALLLAAEAIVDQGEQFALMTLAAKHLATIEEAQAVCDQADESPAPHRKRSGARRRRALRVVPPTPEV